MSLELTTVPRDLYYVERALVQRQADAIKELIAALKDIEFVVDGKEDADDGIPNDAMKIMAVVQTALRKFA